MAVGPVTTTSDADPYRLILELLSVCVIVVRPTDGSIVYTNPSFARMLGYEPSELADKPVSFVHAPAGMTPETRAHEIMAVLRRDGHWSGTILSQHKDGSVVRCEAEIHTFDEPVLGPVWLAEHLDVTERQRMADALSESEARLQSIIDNTTAVIYVKDLDGRYLLINRRFEELFHLSRREVRGRADHDIFPAPIADAFRANDIAVARAMRAIEFDEVVPQDDGDHVYISIKFPLLRADEELYATCGISTDITERVRSRRQLQEAKDHLEHRVAERTAALRAANERLEEEVVQRQHSEERKALLTSELDHRVKNALATVVALADETLGTATSLEDFRATFMGRIQTMARSHEALARTQWQGVDIAEAARLVLAPFEAARPGRITVEGASVQLAAAAALPICLTLHELGTNAIKHGALAGPSGRLTVGWGVHETGLALDWTEHGGSPVSPPQRMGSGMQIVRDLLEGQLGGTLEVRFSPDGFACHVEMPLAGQPDHREPDPVATSSDDHAPVRLEGLRVLVVEDDQLQAKLLTRWLARLGCHVVGPASNATDALRLAQAEALDVAVLDMNLEGRSSEPVADTLAARDVAFAFVTGYGDGGALGRRFPATPRLVKPIDPADLERTLHRIARSTTSRHAAPAGAR